MRDLNGHHPSQRRARLWMSFNTPPAEDSRVIALVLFRLRWALAVILGLAAVATVGYVIMEGYGWIDALYMTVITLGTVGYGETHPLDTAGRLFTIGVIIIGFTTFVYGVSVLTNLFVTGDVLNQAHHRRSKRMREGLSNHVIVVGFGRVGQAVVRGLSEMGQQCVVLDRNGGMETQIRAAGGIEMIGDATNPDDLGKAGIDRAAALISACDQDSENLVVVLTARSTRKDLRIVSRVNHAAWVERLQHAGADVVQSPYPTYGMSLAAASVSRAVLDLHDLPMLGLGTEEIRVLEGSALIGSTISEILREHPFAYVVGLRRADRLHPWHAIDGSIQPGDVLVALGAPDYLIALASAATGSINTPSIALE